MKLATLISALALASTATATAAPCKRARLTVQRVDESSPFVVKMFGFASKDKAAKDAGVTVEADRWQSGNNAKQFTTYYLAAKDRAKLEAYIAGMTKQKDLEIDKDHALVIEKLVTDKGTSFRTHYVLTEILLEEKDIASAEVTTKMTTAPGVAVTLTEAGKTKFAAASKANIDHKLAIIVDGTVASAPIINSEIPGGKIAITTVAATDAEHAAEAKRLADALGCKL